MARLDFFFDPGCPWTWITSRWITEVAPYRDLDVTWRPLSLTLKNEGKELPPDLPDFVRELIGTLGPITLGALRVVEAVRDKHGDAPIGGLYTEYGRRFHHDDTGTQPTFLTDSLSAAGLDAAYADAADDGKWDRRLRDSIAEATSYAGDDAGSPILVFDTEPPRGFCGPVLSPAPTGEEALRLWDHLRAAVDTPGLFEFKRGRDTGPVLPPRP